MEISILDTGKNLPEKNMEIDETLLKNLGVNALPILHLYQWEGDSATYGHFSKPETLINIDKAKQRGLHIAKRITGGGMTFHFCDLAFSFLMPKNHPYFSENTLKNYQFVNQFIVEAIEDLMDEKKGLHFFDPCQKVEPLSQKFCMAKPTKYDVLYLGKKVGGAAQRKTQKGYLHHGTISIAMPDLEYLKDILISKEAFDAICNNSFYFLKSHLEKEKLDDLREKIQKKLVEAMIKYSG